MTAGPMDWRAEARRWGWTWTATAILGVLTFAAIARVPWEPTIYDVMTLASFLALATACVLALVAAWRPASVLAASGSLALLAVSAAVDFGQTPSLAAAACSLLVLGHALRWTGPARRTPASGANA